MNYEKELAKQHDKISEANIRINEVKDQIRIDIDILRARATQLSQLL